MNFYDKILASFNQYNVEYIVVGGMAVNLHGVDRTTKDLDLWINNTEENILQLNKSFQSLHFTHEGIAEALQRIRKGETIIIPDERNILKIDLMGMYSGFLKFQDAYKNCVRFDIGAMKVPVISKEHLIETKIRAGRSKDLSDAATLKEITDKKEGQKGI